jgi:DNA-binding GntR family transcriptional regulator
VTLKILLRESFRIGAKGSHRGRAIKEHGDLLDAIAAGDPERAAHGAALKLLGNAANDLVQLVGDDPSRAASRAMNGAARAGRIDRDPRRTGAPKAKRA